jgi:hypothetical protein
LFRLFLTSRSSIPRKLMMIAVHTGASTESFPDPAESCIQLPTRLL